MQLAIKFVNKFLGIRNLDNYYNILGIPYNATNREIRAAYYRLALKHHPDRGGNKNDFVKISQAYKALLNKNENNVYSYQLISIDTEFLADEVMLRILRYLPINALIAMSQVSNTWCRLSDERGLWKSKLLEACPDINSGELKYLEKNGGYKNACLVLEYLLKKVFNVDAIVSAAKKYPQVGMLFFIGYNKLVHISNNNFFENKFINLGSHFSKIAVTSVQAANALLSRAKLIHKECGAFNFCLEEIAGTNIDFFKLILFNYPKVVNEFINNHTSSHGYEAVLGYFLTNIDKRLNYPSGLIDEFIASDFFASNYTSNHIDLVY